MYGITPREWTGSAPVLDAEFVEAVEALLSDILSMHMDEHEFGPFSRWNWDACGTPDATVEWPNLKISADKVRDLLKRKKG